MSLNLRSFAIAAASCLMSAVAGAQCPASIQRLNADRHFDEAKAQMQAIVARTPNDDSAWECLGRVVNNQQRHREASEYFEKATKINDKVATHHLLLGSALADLADSTGKLKLPFLARRIKGEFERTVA